MEEQQARQKHDRVGIILGILVWGVVGSCTRFFVLQTPETGMFEGMVAGVWAAWAFFHHGRVQRYNFLHPVPKALQSAAEASFCKNQIIIEEKHTTSATSGTSTVGHHGSAESLPRSSLPRKNRKALKVQT